MSLEVEVTRDSCILMEDTEMWWDWQDKCWSCRTEVPASCFLFKTKKLGFYFHLNQLNKAKRKRRGGKKCFWWSAWQVVKSSDDFSVPSSCMQRKTNSCFCERVCHDPDGIMHPHISETTRQKTVHFAPALLLLAGGGEGNLKGFLWCLKQQTSQQRDKLCPCVQSCLCVSGEISTLPTDFVGSLINCCYCQFTAYPSCCLDPD